MIKRLWHEIFHMVPGINPRPISALQLRCRAWYGSLGIIPGPIWKMSCNNLLLFVYEACHTTASQEKRKETSLIFHVPQYRWCLVSSLASYVDDIYPTDATIWLKYKQVFPHFIYFCATPSKKMEYNNQKHLITHQPNKINENKGNKLSNISPNEMKFKICNEWLTGEYQKQECSRSK